MEYTEAYLSEVVDIARRIDRRAVERLVYLLGQTRSQGGRLFILGVGGSAANASHAVNDFRKIAAIESYSPCDNVSELTARINDEGWETVFTNWLQASRLSQRDAVLALSVGGGDLPNKISTNLVAALEFARGKRATVLGIVGRDGGSAAKLADACVIIPTVNPEHVTVHTEAFQAVIWHLLISHPDLRVTQPRWESLNNVVPEPTQIS